MKQVATFRVFFWLVTLSFSIARTEGVCDGPKVRLNMWHRMAIFLLFKTDNKRSSEKTKEIESYAWIADLSYSTSLSVKVSCRSVLRLKDGSSSEQGTKREDQFVKYL